MGVFTSPLPKPVDSVLVERCGASSFQVGVAGMNGWRPSMEDAHVIHVRDTWGFFGVFDGHGGSECSEFLASRLQQELEAEGLPKDDAAVGAMMLGLDQEFLDLKQRSGSTGTFAIIEKPATPEGQYALRIGNAGDSRIVLGHVDGNIFCGPGTDSALTTDHKPDLPSEKLRIERTGHKVCMSSEGVARISGDLTVSRAFGNAKFKQSPDVAPQEQAVSAEPEFGSFACKGSDFVVLMCDGVCEGQLSNAEVVSLAASELAEHGDPGRAATAVCRKALEQSSRDNLTCMIVLLGGGELSPEMEFLPGSFSAPEHEGFRKVYENVARAANLSLGQAVERRYDSVKEELRSDALGDERRGELEIEAERYHGGPPCELFLGSKERTQWFEDWKGVSNDSWDTIMRLSQQVKPREKTCLRSVTVPSEDILRCAINGHSALKWEPPMALACNSQAQVVEDDTSDGTSMVQYGPGFSTKAWLPTSVLISA